MSPTLKYANPNLVLMAKDYATNNVMHNCQINNKIVLDLEVEPLSKQLPFPVKGIEGINSWFSSFHCIWDTLIVFLGDSWIKDSGFRTQFIFYVWCTTRRLIHLVYQFSFHIHVAKCLFDVLVALDVYKIEKNEYFRIFLSLTIYSRCLPTYSLINPIIYFWTLRDIFSDIFVTLVRSSRGHSNWGCFAVWMVQSIVILLASTIAAIYAEKGELRTVWDMISEG